MTYHGMRVCCTELYHMRGHHLEESYKYGSKYRRLTVLFGSTEIGDTEILKAEVDLLLEWLNSSLQEIGDNSRTDQFEVLQC